MEKSFETYEQAQNYLYGLENEEIDYSKAYDHFLKAIDLGNIDAYKEIGLMHREGNGVEKSKKLEYLFLTEGIAKGDTTCYAELAYSYQKEDNNIEAIASWSSYFILTPVELIRAYHAYYYVEFVMDSNIKLRYIDKLSRLKVDLIEFVNEGDEDIIDEYSIIDFIKENIPDHNYEYDETYILEMASMYRYGLGEYKIDFKKSIEYYEKYFYLIETPIYQQLLSKYYQNDEGDELFEQWINKGISNGDHNCLASKAIMFNYRGHIAIAQLYWDKYFRLSKQCIEPLFALEYIHFVQDTGVKFKFEKIIKPLVGDMRLLNKEILQNLHKLESSENIHQLLDACNIFERGMNKYF